MILRPAPCKISIIASLILKLKPCYVLDKARATKRKVVTSLERSRLILVCVFLAELRTSGKEKPAVTPNPALSSEETVLFDLRPRLV